MRNLCAMRTMSSGQGSAVCLASRLGDHPYNREIEKINLINRTGYHVSCILLPLLHIDGSSAPSMIKTVGQERNNEHPKFLKLPLYFTLVSIGAWMA